MDLMGNGVFFWGSLMGRFTVYFFHEFPKLASILTCLPHICGNSTYIIHI